MTALFIGFIALRLLLTAIFILGLYKIIVLIKRKQHGRETVRENRGSVTLKERFASGEIDEEKYRRMSAVIGR